MDYVIFPERALRIALNQGHTITTQYGNYLNVPFEENSGKERR